MRVRTLQFHAVITSTSEDEQIVGWRSFACLAAVVSQFASALPDVIVNGQFRNALLILAKSHALLFVTDACPKFQPHNRAPGCQPDREQLLYSRAGNRIGSTA